MYRMILVDDEANIRKGLASLIPWEDYGIEITGQAGNGAEAMELIEQFHPDLAIVDIRMPVMHGLELLDAMRERKDAPKFIILSSYDQFDYVRAAMRLGAKNYLLKPVDTEELITTVIEITHLLDDEHAQKQQFAQSMQALTNNTLNRLLENRIEVRELREKCQLLGITLRCNQMVVGIVKPLFDNQDVSQRRIVFDSLDICRELLNQHLSTYPVADAGDNIALIIKNPESLVSRERLTTILQNCAETIQQTLHVPCIAALGTNAASFKELPDSYQNALRIVELKCLGNYTDIEAETIAEIKQAVNLNFNVETLSKMLLENQREELAQLVVQFLYHTIQKNDTSIRSYVKYQLIELITCMLQAAHKCYIPSEKIEKFRSDIYQKVQAANSAADLEGCVLEFTSLLCDCAQTAYNNDYSSRIQFVVQYVHQHYDDSNLSLKTLANKLSINPAYLGRMFSSETGMYFTDYLNEVRVNHAKELLDRTSLKLSEVAEQVGIANVSYFSTIYKKFTGVRPGQSRKYRTT